MDAAPIPLETLLAHREWVRAVARALVRDPNAADDVEQETWLAALRSPPRHEGSLRGWLGAVARSRARRAGRSETRRVARETAAARRDGAQSSSELAEAADTHRRVVQAVVELEEPYRETILLRYFEGLSIGEVAHWTGAPVETTRSRVKRGIAKLRERLSKELGTDERPWHVALGPLVGGSRNGGRMVTSGGAVMGKSATVAVISAVIVLGALGAVVVHRTSREAAHERAATMSSPDAALPAIVPPKPAVPRVAAPERAETRSEVAAVDPVPPPKTVGERLDDAKLALDWVEEPFLDAMGEIAEASGVDVVLSQEAVDQLHKGREGVIMGLRLDRAIAARQALDLATKLKGLTWTVEESRAVVVPPGVTRDPTKPVVVPPKPTPKIPIIVLGQVTDAQGTSVAGAEIVRVADDRVLARTDIAGRYEVRLTKPFGSLEARAPGHVPSYEVAVDGQPGAQVRIDLPLRGSAGTVVVRVTTETGPARGVVVIVGATEDETASLPDGRSAVKRSRSGATDDAGLVSFEGIAAGAQSVAVRSAGFERVTREVDVVPGGKNELEVRLVRKPPLAERVRTGRLSINVSGCGINDVLHYFGRVTNVNVVVTPAAFESTNGTSITLALSDVPLDEALRRLCDAAGGLEYELDESRDVVMLVPKKR